MPPDGLTRHEAFVRVCVCERTQSLAFHPKWLVGSVDLLLSQQSNHKPVEQTLSFFATDFFLKRRRFSVQQVAYSPAA